MPIRLSRHIRTRNRQHKAKHLPIIRQVGPQHQKMNLLLDRHQELGLFALKAESKNDRRYRHITLFLIPYCVSLSFGHLQPPYCQELLVSMSFSVLPSSKSAVGAGSCHEHNVEPHPNPGYNQDFSVFFIWKWNDSAYFCPSCVICWHFV